MPNKMPEDIEKMLYELDNHDDIERIQKQWFEYQSANVLYEKQYPLQLGNIVEGNLKFKENKSIPTPAEQMHEFNESIRQELYELHGKGKEQEYYLEIDKPGNDNIQSEKPDAVKDFQLTWADVSGTKQAANEKEAQTDKEQDFRLDWDNSPAADNDNHPQDNPSGDRKAQEHSDRIQKVEEFKLTFDTMDKEDHQIDSREIEAERDDFEYDDN